MKNRNNHTKNLNGKNLKVAIILSNFNKSIGKELLNSTVKTLKDNSVIEENIEIHNVPGALEIPLIAKILSDTNKFDTIITLGIILKGETYHFELVANESYRALMNISLKSKIPIIYGIIAANTEEQARNRTKNGKEYALSAIENAQKVNELRKQ